MKYIYLIVLSAFLQGCSKTTVIDIFLKNLGSETLIGVAVEIDNLRSNFGGLGTNEDVGKVG